VCGQSLVIQGSDFRHRNRSRVTDCLVYGIRYTVYGIQIHSHFAAMHLQTLAV
jgi:hypothetical protein